MSFRADSRIALGQSRYLRTTLTNLFFCQKIIEFQKQYHFMCSRHLVNTISSLLYPIAWRWTHYCDVIMDVMASQITSLAIVYSNVHSDVDQRKHDSSASMAFVWGIHRRTVNSTHKWPVTRKIFPFDDVIMQVNNHHLDQWWSARMHYQDDLVLPRAI